MPSNSPEEKIKQLSEIPPEKLAQALLRLADYNKEAEQAVERLLSKSAGTDENFKKRLTAIKRRKRFISWRECSAYARELESLLEDLKSDVSDPKTGLLAVADFFKADKYIIEACDDSNGSIGDVFKIDAHDLLVHYASACDDKEWVGDLIIKTCRPNDYGLRDEIFSRMDEYMPEPLIRKLIDKITQLAAKEVSSKSSNELRFALASLAQQLKDPQLLEKAQRMRGELTTADQIEIAKLHHESGNSKAAEEWLDRLNTRPGYMVNERDNLYFLVQKKLDNPEKAEEVAWHIFRRHRDLENLQKLLSVIGQDKRDKVLADETKTIFSNERFNTTDLLFLLNAGRIEDAEKYLFKNAAKVDGDYYPTLLELAKLFHRQERYLAESLIYRALTDSILRRAVSKNYHHAINYLEKLDLLAFKINDWSSFPSHKEYMDLLRQKHKLKTSLWSRLS